MRTLARISVIVVLCVAVWYGCADHDSVVVPMNSSYPVEGMEGAHGYDWAVGPIDGITTAWHPTPAEIVLPVGTRLLLKCGGKPGCQISWVNAQEVRRVGPGSIAECRIAMAGRHEIQVYITPASEGGTKGGKDIASVAAQPAHTCIVNAVDEAASIVGVRSVAVAVVPVRLPASPSNWELQRAFADNPAQLTQTALHGYRTAVGRPVALSVDPTDARFAGLNEVRVSGLQPRLGTETMLTFDKPGQYVVSVGPPSRAHEITIETYAVSITRDVGGTIPENYPVTFIAHTDPAGYENEVTWIAATRAGSVSPATGHGATFTTTFREPWSPVSGTEQSSEWLGVRADNAAFSQDLTVNHVTTFRVLAPGAHGKAAPCCLEYVHIRIHCPATAACDQGLGLAPTVQSPNTICQALASNTNGDAGDIATQLASGLTAGGCSATATAINSSDWQVTVTLPPGCAAAVCSFASSTIEANACWPILTPAAPINNACYGNGVDSRLEWTGGFRIEQ